MLKRVGVHAGVWNSLHTGDTGSGGPARRLRYETDYYAGVALGLGRGIDVATSFTAYTSPNDIFTTSKEVSVRVGVDDRAALGTWALAPYAIAAFELDTAVGVGQADGGVNGGTYLELGVGPGVKAGRLDVVFPVRVGISLDDYYELAREDHAFFLQHRRRRERTDHRNTERRQTKRSRRCRVPDAWRYNTSIQWRQALDNRRNDRRTVRILTVDSLGARCTLRQAGFRCVNGRCSAANRGGDRVTVCFHARRYEALSTTQEKFAFTVLERAFKDFGLPAAIRTDNGRNQNEKSRHGTTHQAAALVGCMITSADTSTGGRVRQLAFRASTAARRIVCED